MRIRLWAALAACLLLLGGCDTINGFLNYSIQTATPSQVPSLTPRPSFTPTVNLTPDLTPSAPAPTATITIVPTPFYQIIPAQACPLATLHAVRASTAESRQIAWKPGSDALAYIVPLSDQDWYVGDLVVASGKDFSQTVSLTSEIQVAGDLYWSPDGASIAFVAYRIDDAVYTVMVVRGTGKPVDMFPGTAAHYDSYASPKKILQWLNPDHLSVDATCGLDCEQMLDVNVSDGVVNKNGGPARVGTLVPAAVATDQRAYDPKLFPVMSGQVWSPDGSQIVYLDGSGNPWVLSVKGLTQYPLNVNNATVMEMAWSPDGKLLAVRLDGSVEVFQIGCK
jgi:hypothetical protein